MLQTSTVHSPSHHSTLQLPRRRTRSTLFHESRIDNFVNEQLRFTTESTSTSLLQLSSSRHRARAMESTKRIDSRARRRIRRAIRIHETELFFLQSSITKLEFDDSDTDARRHSYESRPAQSNERYGDGNYAKEEMIHSSVCGCGECSARNYGAGSIKSPPPEVEKSKPSRRESFFGMR